MQRAKLLTHWFQKNLWLEIQKKIEDKMGKKEQDKQKAINDVIQLNEEAEIKLLLEIKRYNLQHLHNTANLINDVSVQNTRLEFFKM